MLVSVDSILPDETARPLLFVINHGAGHSILDVSFFFSFFFILLYLINFFETGSHVAPAEHELSV